jgi:hypothetical protein
VDFYYFSATGDLIRTFDITSPGQQVADVVMTPDGFMAVLRGVSGLFAFIALAQ